MHTSAQKTGLAIGCNISYHDLPICVGHSDDGDPIVELKPWPFILPSEMVRPWVQHWEPSYFLIGIGLIFVDWFSICFSPWIPWGPNSGQWRVLGPFGRPEQVGWLLEPHAERVPGPSSSCKCEWVSTDHAIWCFGQFFAFLLHLFLKIWTSMNIQTISEDFNSKVMRASHLRPHIWFSIGNLSYPHDLQIQLPIDSWLRRFRAVPTSMKGISTSRCSVLDSTYVVISLDCKSLFPMLKVTLPLGLNFFDQNYPLESIWGLDIRDLNVLQHHAWHWSTQVMSLSLFVMHFKGDWKYLMQLFSLQRYATREQAGCSYIFSFFSTV